MPRANGKQAIAALHAGGFGDFAARRDALARALKQEGDVAGAAEVKSERKPSISAWSITQLLTHDPDRVRALLAAGEAARGALAAVLGGKDPATLRERMDALQTSIDESRDLAAEHIAKETGRRASEMVLSRVSDDLRALALAPDGAARAARGFLPEDLAPPGLELWSTMPAPAKRAPRAVGVEDEPPETTVTAKRARALDAEERARRDAKAKRDAEERARRDAKTKRDAEERARRDAKAKRDADERARRDAKAKRDADERSRRDAKAKRAADLERAARARAATLAVEADRAENAARETRAEAQALAREADRAERAARDARRRADLAARALGSTE